jgi:hypothetical protein
VSLDLHSFHEKINQMGNVVNTKNTRSLSIFVIIQLMKPYQNLYKESTQERERKRKKKKRQGIKSKQANSRK